MPDLAGTFGQVRTNLANNFSPQVAAGNLQGNLNPGTAAGNLQGNLDPSNAAANLKHAITHGVGTDENARVTPRDDEAAPESIRTRGRFAIGHLWPISDKDGCACKNFQACHRSYRGGAKGGGGGEFEPYSAT